MNITPSAEIPGQWDIYLSNEYREDATMSIHDLVEFKCMLDQFLTVYAFTKLEKLEAGISAGEVAR